MAFLTGRVLAEKQQIRRKTAFYIAFNYIEYVFNVYFLFFCRHVSKLGDKLRVFGDSVIC